MSYLEPHEIPEAERVGQVLAARKCMIGDGYPPGAPHAAERKNASELLEEAGGKAEALKALQRHFNGSGRSVTFPGTLGGECYPPDHADEHDWVCIPGPEGQSKRTFPSGANRDSDDGKLDYEGFLSPEVLQAFAVYMHRHRHMKDGSLRDSDNWQKGFPKGVAEKSLSRHYFDFWIMDRRGVDEYRRPDGEVVTRLDALMGILFNVQAIALQYVRQ